MLAGLQANPSQLTECAGQCDGPLKLRDNHVANFAGESNPTSYKNYPKPIIPYTQHYRFYMTKTPSQCSTPMKETKHMRSRDDQHIWKLLAVNQVDQKTPTHVGVVG